MLKFLHFVIWLAMWIGIGDAMVNTIWKLRESAIHAHRNDQISYGKFSKMLTGK